MLECYLYKQQSIETEIEKKQREASLEMKTYTVEAQTEQASSADKIKKIKEDINSLIEKYDNKIDKHYVLFLF